MGRRGARKRSDKVQNENEQMYVVEQLVARHQDYVLCKWTGYTDLSFTHKLNLQPGGPLTISPTWFEELPVWEPGMGDFAGLPADEM